MAHRRRAHENGAWVRDAATAFAAKVDSGLLPVESGGLP
jgi:hypothetical protein